MSALYQVEQDEYISNSQALNDMWRAIDAKVIQQIEQVIIPQLKNKFDNAEYDIENHKLTLSSTTNATSVDVSFDDIAEIGDNKVDDCEFDEDSRTLSLKANGEVVATCVITGGGGGGGGGGAEFTATNTTGWNQKKISKETEHLYLKFQWSSIEQEQESGPGTIQITVNNVVKVSKSIDQGNITQDIVPYLNEGSNTVKVKISDIYDTHKTFNFRIEVLDLKLTSSYDESQKQSSSFVFTYTPYGSGTKTVYFLMDGTQIATYTTAANGVQQQQEIPAQTHGGHVLSVYFEVENAGEMISSNVVKKNVIAIGGSTVIISSVYDANEAQQYETVEIPYYAYNPASSYTNLTYLYDGTIIGTATATQSLQTFQYTFKEQGSHSLTIKYDDSIYKTFSFTVTESEVDVHVETVARDLYLTAQGRSNSEPESTRSVWKDETTGISCTLEGFNFKANGWYSNAQDSRIRSGETVLRICNNAKLTIPIYLFGSGFDKRYGKTIEFRIAVRDVADFDDVVISCWQGTTGYERGIKLTSRDINFASSSVSLNSKQKDEEYYTIGFVINKSTDTDRVIYTYIDGVMSGAVKYGTNEDFQQLQPVYITIGGVNTATVDVGRVRLYHQNLTRKQVLDNIIADCGNVDDMIDLYESNNILDASGQITINTLPPHLPYLLIEGTLPETKEEGKKTVNVTYVDPVTSSKSFTSAGAACSIQGTSSAG